MLSKIASGMHKPNRQTIVTPEHVEQLMLDLPISRVVGFGGKLGEALAEFNGQKVETFRDVLAIGRTELAAQFSDETTIWMLNCAVGIDTRPVKDQGLVASIGCSKSFRQQNTLPQAALHDGRVHRWLRELAEELDERVTTDSHLNSRKPKQLTVGISIEVIEPHPVGQKRSADPVRNWHATQGTNLSKLGPMCVGAQAIAKSALAMAQRAVSESARLQGKGWNIKHLSLNAAGFVPVANDNQVRGGGEG
jgi:nucleotidyltransferase/DNA polymerase involved in DNA repair